MNNRFMRLLVFFDLPVTTKKLKKEYSHFRKFLLKDGYSMMQYSVYSRVTKNHDDTRKHVKRLKENLPPKGSVRVMGITEKQYTAMDVLVGTKTASEILLRPKDIIEL